MGILIILTGKTASGKDTVMSQLLSKYPQMKRVVSTTTRSPRKGEKDGVDYNFISEPQFRQKMEAGDFIEYVEYGGNLYGSEKSQISDVQNQDLIWRIDPSRAGQIKDLIKDIKVLVIYLTVDDSVILKRLSSRGLSHEEINKRMQEDQKFWQQFKDNYDYIVENVPGKLDETVKQVAKIINEHKI